MRNCRNCGLLLRGRADKRYCDDACRAQFYRHNQPRQSQRLRQIQQILRRNYRLLASLERTNRLNVAKQELADMGFHFGFHTHLKSKWWGVRTIGLFDLWYKIKGNEVVIYREEKVTGQPRKMVEL